jgi:hypothetical protein
MARLFVVKVSVPPSFAKAASIEALQTDKDALGIVLDVSSAVASHEDG